VKGGETGMGWTCVRVVTNNEHTFKNVVIYGSKEIIAVHNYKTIPFKMDEIKDVIVTHRTDFPKNFKGFQTFAGESLS
jgi:hypothetical protein